MRAAYTPLVSVLVTVHNREKWLPACLDSIMASSYQGFEAVVVDDQSQDGSAGIAEMYADMDARIRFCRNERNLGDYPNRMRAAELARGTYLKYVDSDDLISPHSLAIMVEAMEAHPEAALGLSHSLPEDEEPYPWCLSPEAAWRKQFLGRGCLSCGPTGAIIRREAFIESGGFRDWGVLNDMDLWYRLSARWPVVLLPPGLVWWRRHEGQEFTRDDAAMVYLERGFALTMETLQRAGCPLNEADRQRAIARARQHQARRLLSLARRHPMRAWRLHRKSGLSLGELAKGLGRYR
jgi:glycosyltransferase involved in cell wall biosynthesis